MEDYNRISAIVMWLGNNTVLKMSVGLYKSNKNNIVPAYNEYTYYSESHHKEMTSIRLNYDYYLSIENTLIDKDTNSKGFFRIRYPEIYLINLLLDKISRWFIDTQFNGLFYIKDNELHVSSKFNIKEEMPTDQCNLIAEPIAIKNDFNQRPGVRLTFTRLGNFVDIDSSILFGMNVFFKRCDLFLMAQSLMNFIKQPPMGTNKVSMNPVQSQIIHTEKDTKGRGILGRQIGKNKSDIDQL